MRSLVIAAGLLVGLVSVSAQARIVDSVFVKSELEKRFSLQPRDVGMQSISIPSSDCRVRIVDGSQAGGTTNDQAALQVMKGEKTLTFFISPKMSYSAMIGPVIDFVSEKKGGLVTHSTLLKISAEKLSITRLSLYPSENQPENERTLSMNCSL